MRGIFLLFFWFLAAGSLQAKATILVTIPPYAYLVQRLMGEEARVETIVPQGMDPHLFEMSPKQAGLLGESEIWLRIEEPFEARLIPLLQQQSPRIKIFNLLDGVSGLFDSEGCCHEAMDRHVWLSPRRVMGQVKRIGRLLQEQYPERTAALVLREASLLADLELLDCELKAALSSHAGKSLLVSHPAFGYFAEDYGLRQLSVEQEGKEPLPRQVGRFLQEATQAKVSTVIGLPQYSNRGAERIAEQLQLRVRVIDPYAYDYFAMMRQLLDAVVSRD